MNNELARRDARRRLRDERAGKWKRIHDRIRLIAEGVKKEIPLPEPYYPQEVYDQLILRGNGAEAIVYRTMHPGYQFNESAWRLVRRAL